MVLIEIFILVVTLVMLAYFVYKKVVRSKPSGSPPGPWGFPIVGHLPLLGEFPYKKVLNWSKTYGPIISIRFGSYPTVVINDIKLIREALNEPSCQGRPAFKFIKDRSNGVVKGLIFTEGKEWSDQRRFALRHLRDFGFGKKSMESIVSEEIADLLDHLQKDIGKPFCTTNKFNAAVLNTLWSIVTGKRFQQDDPELQMILRILTENIQETRYITAISVFLPWLADLAPGLSGYTKLMSGTPIVKEFVRKPIAEHEESFRDGDLRDFIDAYLQELKRTVDPNSCFHPSKSDDLIYVLLDLFVAGAETTSTTISWTFLYLAKFPKEQTKLQAEIDKVIGKSRLPSLSDRISMPFTQALIHEVLRFSSLIPFSMFHRTVKDVQLGGYTIPEDTLIAPNLYAVHFDKDIWGDPETFRPERFIDENANFKKNDAMLAFSAGKRACLGEPLAKDQLFLFITSLFQKLSVSIHPDAPKLDLTPIVSTVLTPLPHQILIENRN